MRISDWSSDVCSSDHNADWIEEGSDLRQALDTQFARCTVSGTLDFIETDHGPMFLEAGPPVSPFGGGHPCAFAGAGVQGNLGTVPEISGVAFRIMEHVTLADPSTWKDGDRTGRIRSEESRVGKACVSTCSSRGSPYY